MFDGGAVGTAWPVRRDRVVDANIARAKQILRQLHAVSALWLQGCGLDEIARELSVQPHRIYFCLRALQLEDSRTTRRRRMEPERRPGDTSKVRLAPELRDLERTG